MPRLLLRALRFAVPAFVAFAVWAVCLSLSPASLTRAQEGNDPVVKVEEKWSLTINEPAPELDSPQLNTVMSPGGTSLYGLFTINYRDYRGFIPGGVGAEVWDGDDQLSTRSQHTGHLNSNNETITWTQVLEVNGLELKFKVVNGTSESWGSFGGDTLTVSRLLSGSLTLDAYDSATSANHAVITFGGNRVESLTLVEVRQTRLSGAVSVDSTPRVVFTGDAAEQ